MSYITNEAKIPGLNSPRKNASNVTPLIITDEVADRWNVEHPEAPQWKKVPKELHSYFRNAGYHHFIPVESHARLIV